MPAALSTQHSAPGTATIVAGQQPAIGGGPLYTLVKCCQAVALARAQQGQPVFWCASEDHDLGEADHVDLILPSGDLRRVRGDLGDGRASLRFRPACAGWNDLIAACREHFGHGLGADFLSASVPHADEPLGAWHCRLLSALLPELRCVEAHTLRPAWTHLWPDIVARWPAAELACARANVAEPALPELPAPPVFRDDAQGRVPLTPAQILATDPLLLSPGAALRPVVQQAALAATHVVLGPGERAYHALIGPLYAALGQPRPAIVPRTTVTLVPGAVARACDRAGVDPAAIVAGADWPAAPVPTDTALIALDAAISGLGPRATRRLRRERDRIAATLARQARAGLAPGAARAWLRPRNAPQDRTLSLFQAVWMHGPGLAALLVDALGSATPGSAIALPLSSAHRPRCVPKDPL